MYFTSYFLDRLFNQACMNGPAADIVFFLSTTTLMFLFSVLILLL
jgi:hypothetical protein